MSKLTAVFVTLAAFAAGLAVGLVIGTLGGDRIVTSRETRALLAAKQRIDELSAESENKHQDTLTLVSASLKANAFIGMLIDYPALREALLSPPVSDSFRGKGEWFYPQIAMELMGGKWLADELIAEGLLRQTDLDAGDILNATESFGTTRKLGPLMPERGVGPD